MNPYTNYTMIITKWAKIVRLLFYLRAKVTKCRHSCPAYHTIILIHLLHLFCVQFDIHFLISIHVENRPANLVVINVYFAS